MIEALLAGCPVIAFRRGAAPEVIDDGETGFLVEGMDGMVEALRRAKTLDRAAIQARARLRFSAERMAAEYVAVYRAAGAHGRAPAPAPAPAAEDGWTTLAT
jgi:glycosyltransferase involved in cell wall biosynthesis